MHHESAQLGNFYPMWHYEFFVVAVACIFWLVIVMTIFIEILKYNTDCLHQAVCCCVSSHNLQLLYF